MDFRLEQALGEIEAACAGIELALLAEDWQSASLGNEYLNAKLARLGALLDDREQPPDRGSVELAVQLLAHVLERHAGLAEQLIVARDAAGDELVGLRRGRRAASHYVDTAETPA